jgi:hypothetical protein
MWMENVAARRRKTRRIDVVLAIRNFISTCGRLRAPAVRQTLAAGSHELCGFPPFARKKAKDGAPALLED